MTGRVRRYLHEMALARLSMTAPKRKAKGDTDFGLYMDEDAALESFGALMEHGVLARAGGWLDQPQHWRRTMAALQSEYGRIAAELAAQKRGRQEG